MSSFSWFVKCYVLKEPKHLILKVKTITTHTPRRSTFRIALNKFSCTLELDKFTPMLITNTQTEVKKKKTSAKLLFMSIYGQNKLFKKCQIEFDYPNYLKLILPIVPGIQALKILYLL